MTDQDNESGTAAGGGSPVVVVEQSTARHKPYRPTDLQDESPPERHHKHSRAPAVPSVAEELKNAAENADIKEQKECDTAMSSEKHKHIVAKKSLTTKRRTSSPEAIALAPVDVQRADVITPPPQPIPAPVGPAASVVSEKKAVEIKEDEDSITEEIAELRTADPTQKAAEWFDEEEAGGLPRSDSRASRVSRASRAVRQLFCCGVPYDAPSEDNVSYTRSSFNGI